MILDYYPSFAFKYTLCYTCENSYATAYYVAKRTRIFYSQQHDRPQCRIHSIRFLVSSTLFISLFFCIIFGSMRRRARLKNFHCRWSINQHHYRFGLNTNM